MVTRNLKISHAITAALIASSISTGCDSDEDDKNEYDPTRNYYDSRDNNTSGSNFDFRFSCVDDGSDFMSCKKTEKAQWKSNCRWSECENVTVGVQYLLTDDLGSGRSVQIDAFDNPTFEGEPKSSVTIFDFDASQPGVHVEESLKLSPGAYYLRAYLTDQSTTTLPYEYQGMNLIQEQPVGFCGALSSPQKIIVENHTQNPLPTMIYLDKLFKDPSTQVNSKAHLRLILSLTNHNQSIADTPIKIELFDRTDFAYRPVEQFSVLGAIFQTSSETNTAEYVSPQLKVGSYFLRVYIDQNKNGYFDDGEPVYIHTEDDTKQLVNMIESRTETIHLAL